MEVEILDGRNTQRGGFDEHLTLAADDFTVVAGHLLGRTAQITRRVGDVIVQGVRGVEFAYLVGLLRFAFTLNFGEDFLHVSPSFRLPYLPTIWRWS